MKRKVAVLGVLLFVSWALVPGWAFGEVVRPDDEGEKCVLIDGGPRDTPGSPPAPDNPPGDGEVVDSPDDTSGKPEKGPDRTDRMPPGPDEKPGKHEKVPDTEKPKNKEHAPDKEGHQQNEAIGSDFPDAGPDTNPGDKKTPDAGGGGDSLSTDTAVSGDADKKTDKDKKKPGDQQNTSGKQPDNPEEMGIGCQIDRSGPKNPFASLFAFIFALLFLLRMKTKGAVKE